MYNENQISFWICWFVWNWLVDWWIDWIDGILWRRFTWKMYIWFLSWIIYSQMIIQLLLKFISCFYSSSLIHRVLNDITTKYVLMIDSSVEFTHNSNLPRMLALLQSNQGGTPWRAKNPTTFLTFVSLNILYTWCCVDTELY